MDALTAAEQDRAALCLLSYATSNLSAEDRRHVVEKLLERGAHGTVGWIPKGLGHSRFSRLVQRIEKGTADPNWPQAMLQTIKVAAQHGARLVARGDNEWPAALEDLGTSAPIALWVRGVIPELEEGSLSVVGSRNLSSEGHARIHRTLSNITVPIISGLAAGADRAAHCAALDAGTPTVAVIACDVNRPYPYQNVTLADRIIRGGGAVISEMPAGTSVNRERLLDRNRIIVALSTGMLVAEAGSISGSLSSARHAHRLGRRLGAFPGSAGTDKIIASRAGIAVLSIADIEHLAGQDRAGI